MESPPFIARARNPFPVRRISTFMGLIATIGLGFGLFRASPVTCYRLIAIAVFTAPSAFFARHRLAVMQSRVEAVRIEDRA
jgi:hypothetical protein